MVAGRSPDRPECAAMAREAADLEARDHAWIARELGDVEARVSATDPETAFEPDDAT